MSVESDRRCLNLAVKHHDHQRDREFNATGMSTDNGERRVNNDLWGVDIKSLAVVGSKRSWRDGEVP